MPERFGEVPVLGERGTEVPDHLGVEAVEQRTAPHRTATAICRRPTGRESISAGRSIRAAGVMVSCVSVTCGPARARAEKTLVPYDRHSSALTFRSRELPVPRFHLHRQKD